MGRARRVAALALLSACALAAGACTLAARAPSAAAVIVRLQDGRALSYEPPRQASSTMTGPLDAFFANVEYNGGPVMPSNTNYAFYWDPPGAPAYPAEYQAGIDQYFEALAHDSGGHENVDSVSAQYEDAAGEFAGYDSRFGGAIVDEDPYPANGCQQAAICLTTGQLESELRAYTAAHDLPTGFTHEYFVLTPPGVEGCFEAYGEQCSAGTEYAAYCSYHSYVPLASGEIIFADNPYVTGNERCDDGNHPNGKPSDGVLEGGLVHEHEESLTDPEPNSGWLELASEQEIADKCRDGVQATEFGTPLGTAPDGAKYNQVIDGHLYWYQQMWSNQGQRCLQRLDFSGEQPIATFASTQGAGEEVAFNASASSAPGGVARYDWQFDGGLAPEPSVETTTPNVTHSFPEAGGYLVALTVYASNGTSGATAHQISVGEPAPPPPTVTKLTPKSGRAAGATKVTITGTNFKEVTAVAFGSTGATSFTVDSATKILAISPAATSGAVSVTVTTAAGTSAVTSADTFKYGAPTITALAPHSGPLAGGTSVTISGSGFAAGAGTTIDFGAHAAGNVQCQSSSSCTAVSPAAAKAANVDVVAVVGKQRSKKDPPADQFTYP